MTGTADQAHQQRERPDARRAPAPFDEALGLETEAIVAREATLSASATPAGVAAALPRVDRALRAGALERLQQEHGNLHVQRMIQRLTGPIVARQPVPAAKPAAKGKTEVPDAAALVAAKYPKLQLPAEQMTTLQKVFDARARIKDLEDQMKPLLNSILSDDVSKLEALREQGRPDYEFLHKNQALYVPTERILVNDILLKEKEKEHASEAAFREQLFKTLIAHPTMLVIGEGLAPATLFNYMWGPNRWTVNNDGGLVGFNQWMQIQKFNIAYQAILTGQMVNLLTEMAEITRDAGKTYDMNGKRVGEYVRPWLWNASVKVGFEQGKLTGYYNDARGQSEMGRELSKVKGAKIVLLAPDQFLHFYSLEPNFNSYDLTNPDKDISGKAKDGNVYLFDKGTQVSGVVTVMTGDGYELEKGSTDSGSGWRCSETMTIYEQFAIGAILGDAFEDPSATMTFGQIIIGVIPVVGQIADARDVIVGIHKMWTTGGKDGKLQTALALIGFIPLIGDGIKSAWKVGKKEAKAAGKGMEQVAKQAVKEGAEKTGAAAEKELATTLLKNTDEVIKAFPHLEKGAVEAVMKDLRTLGEKAAKGDLKAGREYAEKMAKQLDALGGNAGSLVTMAGGEWKAITKALTASPEGALLGNKMQAWRVAQFDALEKKVSQEMVSMGPDIEKVAAPKLERTGTPSFTSDVDVSFLGPSATAHRNAAFRVMEREYGSGWKKLMDADIFADPSRLHLFEGPLEKLGGTAAKAAERRIVKESELNVLAKMLQTGADAKEVQKLAKQMGVDMALVTARQKEVEKLAIDNLADMLRRNVDKAEVEKMAAEMGVKMDDVTKHLATGETLYREMELKLDVLHKKFLDAEGDAARQATIAEEMATIQGKLNAAASGPYMTPGGGALRVTRREAKLRPGGAYKAMSPAMGYMAVLDDVYMLEHALGDVAEKGFTEGTAKSMAKYGDRVLVTAGQFGVDMSGKSTRPLFDTVAGLLERARLEKDRKPIELAMGNLESAKGALKGQLDQIVAAVKKNADDYLATAAPGVKEGGDMVTKSTAALARAISTLMRAKIRSAEPAGSQQQTGGAAPQPMPAP